jgi:hypothetical protein
MVRADGDGLATALEALRDATREHARTGDSSALLTSVRELACRARECGMRAEQAIIELKRLWASMPEVASSPGADRRHLQEELVTLCISEFFRAPQARR